MAAKDERTHKIKNEPNVDITDITHIKVEPNYNDLEIKVGNIEDVKPEPQNEILPKIKQEEIYLKDATPSGSNQCDDLPLKFLIKQSFDRILQKHTQSFLLSMKRQPQFPHLKKTRQKPKFYCALCQYKANKKVNLERHMIIHTREKPSDVNPGNLPGKKKLRVILPKILPSGQNICGFIKERSLMSVMYVNLK